jgi:hypothetical protein
MTGVRARYEAASGRKPGDAGSSAELGRPPVAWVPAPRGLSGPL